jgi:hypothetical protein
MSLRCFLLRKVFEAQAINTAGRRPAGGVTVSRPFPELHNRRLALLPSALFGGAVAPVPAGCPQLETGAAVSEPN